jgi:acylaminoacyl-peptidase
MDAFGIEYATDVRISPDGERILFVRNGADVMTDQRIARVWMADVLGRHLQPLGGPDERSRAPRWSPGGERVAYVVDGPDGSRIRVRWMDTGDEVVAARLSEAPRDLAWSPDGRRIAYAAFTPEVGGPATAYLPAPPPGAEWAPPARATRRLSHRRDGIGSLRPGSEQIYVVPADGGTPTRITGDGFRYRTPGYAGAGLAWSADGREVLVAGRDRESPETDPLDTDLWAWPALGGPGRRITHRNGPDFLPRVSPDGETVAYLGFDDRRRGFQTTHLYVTPVGGGRSTVVAPELDRSILDHRWAPDGRSLLVSYDQEGVTIVARLDLSGGMEVLARNVGGGFGLLAYGGELGAGGFTVARTGRFAAVRSDPSTPGDVAVSAPDGSGPLQTVTDLNDDVLGRRTLGRVEEIRWASSRDGAEIQGWLVYPPDFEPEGRYPLILEIHGGPFAAYGPRFDLEKQLMAARGYVVLYANPRGSTGYGEAFADAIHHDFPGDEYLDLLSGVDAVLRRGFVDPDRLFVSGGSGGGMETAWIIGKTRRFRAAGVHYPVVDWRSFTLTSDIAPFVLRYWFGGLPWEDPEAFRARSPLSLVDSVETPTLVLTGEEDRRTPASQAEMYYTALKMRGVDAVLVRVPDEFHGVAGHPSHQLAKVLATLEWFDAASGRTSSAAPPTPRRRPPGGSPRRRTGDPPGSG